MRQLAHAEIIDDEQRYGGEVGEVFLPGAVDGRFSGVHQWPVLGIHRGRPGAQGLGAVHAGRMTLLPPKETESPSPRRCLSRVPLHLVGDFFPAQARRLRAQIIECSSRRRRPSGVRGGEVVSMVTWTSAFSGRSQGSLDVDRHDATSKPSSPRVTFRPGFGGRVHWRCDGSIGKRFVHGLSALRQSLILPKSSSASTWRRKVLFSTLGAREQKQRAKLNANAS